MTLHSFDSLVRSFRRQVQLPWRTDVPASGRVWILWYDRSLELRVGGQWPLLEQESARAGHGWRSIDAGPMFAQWLDGHELRDAVLSQPDELGSLLPEFEDAVVEQLTTVLDAAAPDDLVAVKRCGALFGLASLSKVVNRVESSVQGRLLLSFAGRYEGTGYRLLDARPGWNYHAVPIPSEPA
jgi:hypothetical protein